MLVGGMMISGCSGPAPLADETGPVEEESVAWSDVETFDASEYADLPMPRPDPVDHDVPSELMESSLDDGIVMEVPGYRVQVFSSTERDTTLQVEEAVRSWLDSLTDARRAELGLARQTAVYSLFRAPYYRVRVGDFETRGAAEPLSAAIGRRFDGALIVPDRVQIRR